MVEQYDDSGRLLQEGRAEVDVDDALPQMISSEVNPHGPELGDIWPEHWGITIGQLQELLDECKQDPKWCSSHTVRDLVNNYVVPKTLGTGMGYALFCNCRQPLEVSVVVSSCWLQNAEELVDRLGTLVSPREGLYICGLALYQCEDGFGPTIQQQLGTSPEQSPFMRVVRHLSGLGELEKEDMCRLIGPFGRAAHFLTLSAVACIIMPTVWKGCVPFFSECAKGAGASSTDSVWLPISGASWSYEPSDMLSSVLVTVGAIVGIIGAFSWLKVGLSPFQGGRMIAVPNFASEFYGTSRGAGSGCCSNSAFMDDAMQAPEPGVVMLEMFSAQAAGIPVVIANSLPERTAAERRAGAARTTKEDTETLEIGGFHTDAPDKAFMEQNYDDINAVAIASLEKERVASSHVEAAELLTLWLCDLCAFRLGALRYAASIGSLEADFGWSLAIGFGLGFATWYAILGRMAWRSAGRFRAKGLWSIAVALLLVSAVCSSCLGIVYMCFNGAMEEVPGNHIFAFVSGASSALLQGSVVLSAVLMTETGCHLVGRRLLADVQNIVGFLCLIGGVVAMACSVCERPRHLFPAFVFVASGVYGLVLGPVACLRRSLSRWGIVIQR